jgi:hypothetical protein
MDASSIFTELRIRGNNHGQELNHQTTSRTKPRRKGRERKVAKRQERKVQQSKLPVDPAGERIEPPALASQGSD